MYKITAVRYNFYNGINKKCKGAFSMYFDTLSDFALFVHNNGLKTFYFPYLKKELTNNERKLLNIKCNSLYNKAG